MVHSRRITERAMVSISGQMDENSKDGGIKINAVTKASGAEKAGLKEGDIITGINKTTISSLINVINVF